MAARVEQVLGRLGACGGAGVSPLDRGSRAPGRSGRSRTGVTHVPGSPAPEGPAVRARRARRASASASARSAASASARARRIRTSSHRSREMVTISGPGGGAAAGTGPWVSTGDPVAGRGSATSERPGCRPTASNASTGIRQIPSSSFAAPLRASSGSLRVIVFLLTAQAVAASVIVKLGRRPLTPGSPGTPPSTGGSAGGLGVSAPSAPGSGGLGTGSVMLMP